MDDIDLLSKDEADMKFFKLISKSYLYRDTITTIEVINHFDEMRIQVDPLPALTNMFLNPHFTIELWKWVISCFPEKEPTGYFLDLINYRNDKNCIKISKILTELFTDITIDEWQQLLELTNDFEDAEYENILFREFLILKTRNSAKSPHWLINNNDPLELPSFPNNFPNVEDAINLILDDIKRSHVNIIQEDDEECDKLKTNLIGQYSVSTSEEKILILSNIMKIQSFDDSSIFQEYGPVNTSFTKYDDPNEEHKCSKYGGCRMLLCDEYVDTIDYTSEDIIVEDWFTGICQQCNKNIRYKHYGLRMPLHFGGWKGCYCSFPCLEKDINDLTIALMVGRIKHQLESIGIRNR